MSVQVAGSDFFHPGSHGSVVKKIPDPQQRIEVIYRKKLYLRSRPDPDLDYFYP